MTLEEFQALDEEQRQYMLDLMLHGTPDDEGFMMKQLPLWDRFTQGMNPWAKPRMSDEWQIAPGKTGRLPSDESTMPSRGEDWQHEGLAPTYPVDPSLGRDAEHWRRPAVPPPSFVDPGSFEDLRIKEQQMEHPDDPGWGWDIGRAFHGRDPDVQDIGDPTLKWEQQVGLSPALQHVLLQALRG